MSSGDCGGRERGRGRERERRERLSPSRVSVDPAILGHVISLAGQSTPRPRPPVPKPFLCFWSVSVVSLFCSLLLQRSLSSTTTPAATSTIYGPALPALGSLRTKPTPATTAPSRHRRATSCSTSGPTPLQLRIQSHTPTLAPPSDRELPRHIPHNHPSARPPDQTRDECIASRCCLSDRLHVRIYLPLLPPCRRIADRCPLDHLAASRLASILFSTFAPSTLCLTRLTPLTGPLHRLKPLRPLI